MKKQLFWLAATLLLISPFAFHQEKSPDIVAIKGARIVPVVGAVIEEGTILIRNGKIEALGAAISVPAGASVVEAKGLIAYPGMIDGSTCLGLNEISNVAATTDFAESGTYNPQLRAVEALKPDSVHIPIARAHGVTAALIVPQGGLISGQSGLIRLFGWTPQEMVVRSPVGMHITVPTIPPRMRKQVPAGEPTVLEELGDLFSKARYYEKRREAARKNMALPLPDFDETLEALLPVVKGEIPVMFSVDGEKEIKETIAFVEKEKLRAVFFGAGEGWKVASEIKKSGIPVVLGSLFFDFPSNYEDGYDAIMRNAAVLHQAGVKIAFSSQRYLPPLSKDLPFQASKAVAFGLDPDEALRAVTINPAQIFGVEAMMGSLEKGKTANIVLADGDILEYRTKIKSVFIDGREMDLSNKYTELLEKYEKRDGRK